MGVRAELFAPTEKPRRPLWLSHVRGSDSRPGSREYGILTVIEVRPSCCPKAHVHHLITGSVPGLRPRLYGWADAVSSCARALRNGSPRLRVVAPAKARNLTNRGVRNDRDGSGGSKPCDVTNSHGAAVGRRRLRVLLHRHPASERHFKARKYLSRRRGYSRLVASARGLRGGVRLYTMHESFRERCPLVQGKGHGGTP